MAENSEFKIKTMSKAELCDYYKISKPTLLVWLARIPELEDYKHVKLFTPAQVLIITTHLGTP